MARLCLKRPSCPKTQSSSALKFALPRSSARESGFRRGREGARRVPAFDELTFLFDTFVE